MKTKTVQGYYGSNNTPCDIFVAETRHGYYYVVDGGCMVNLSEDSIELGCDVEEVEDLDCFTWSSPITSEEELIDAIES